MKHYQQMDCIKTIQNNKIQTAIKKYKVQILKMSYLTNSDNSLKLTLPTKSQQKFTIGRTSQNSLQILDSTVSKNHAVIYYFANEKKYVLQDLGSINGTYVNGSLLSGAKEYLKHNDEIQFGKSNFIGQQCVDDEVYLFRSLNPQPEKKGKINFKDYHFQLEDELDTKPIMQLKKAPPLSSINTKAQTQAGWNKASKIQQQPALQIKGKQKFQRPIKIPKFEQFLQMQGSELSEQPAKNIPQYQQTNGAPKKWAKNIPESGQKGTVKLPELNRAQLSEEDKLNKMIIERKKELQRAEKEGLLRKAQQQQKMIEERLRLQLQRAQQQQQLLQQKYQIQLQAQQQEQNLAKQKALLQQKLRLQQQQAKQKQQLRLMQLKQKQQSLVQQITKVKEYEMLKLKQKEQEVMRQLKEQKDKQVMEIRESESRKRLEKEEEIKKEVEGRKRELQMEAQALARQYENIYKETIKKLKLNIEAEQGRVTDLQSQIEKIDKETQQLGSCIDVEEQEQKILKQDFNDITGRNKAFLLYASHLQTKIDQLKIQLQKTSIKDPTRTTLQLKDSLTHSRKLLNMKLNQHKQLQSQSKQSFMRLNINSPQSQQYLSTILQNYQQIQRLKQLYFQFLEEEKVIENRWDLELEENNVLEERLRNVRKEIQGNRKKLAENLNDNLKKLTEQRLHMLKMMYYVPEQKKTAAKYLIQQMLNIQTQNKTIILDSEQVHQKITQLIISIQEKKQQNQHLSTIIFGNDITSHHFDNMKAQINRLIESIESQKDQFKLANIVRMSQELKDLENGIYLETKREKKLKDQIRNVGYTVPPLNTEKNPLVFFGKMLAKKQNQLGEVQQQEKNLEKKLIQMRAKVSNLTQKKTKINQLLQDYKQKQLRNIRDYLK